MLTRSRKIGFMVLLAGSRRTRFFSREEPLEGRLAVVVADGDDLAVAGLSLACG